MRRIGPLLCLGIGLPACDGTLPEETFVSGAAWVVPQANAEDRVPLTGAGLIEDERNTISIYGSLAPAVVYVEQTQVVRDPFSRRALEVDAGTGTGFIWDRQGHIVTNFHVIDGARSLRVTLENQKTYDAVLVGGERRRDVAVLKIDAPEEELVAVELPSQETPLLVGQKALAIGNPFGLDHTLTVGVISALDREVQGYGGVTIPGMIQTDASINPGNSGGPLLDSKGRLIGMNTQIFSSSGASAGIGFAVPSSIIRRVVPQIIEHGKVVQAGMGVTIVPDSFARRLGVEGVILDEIRLGTPAATAGMVGMRYSSSGRPTDIGDVVVDIGGTPILDYDDLYNVLDRYRPGDDVSVTLERAGRRRVVSVTLMPL